MEITPDMIENAIEYYLERKKDAPICGNTFVEDFWLTILRDCPEVLVDEMDGMAEVLSRLIECYKNSKCKEIY